ncbi:ATP-binding cassette domain-containing protein [Silvanigrella paludirubra]|uniref:ATP-binding cassette domain-containing protein n=1 Tax=Silvanigrella paludirubra TaxID=2499159 RepID=A0A6N6VSY4_9BACT|nr:ABC transporter ATP-binding protein [Silvanigrella paludirubra]KAB8036079.1 ATP-binding cassette domain-containing protein [Silvanigrella paludirubra]
MIDFICIKNLEVVYQVRKITNHTNFKQKLIHIFKSEYEYRTILNNVNLNLNKPGITSIVGKNGSGKTTLIKSIVGIISAKNGVISIFGENISKKHFLNNIGVIFSQKSSLFMENSLIENLQMTLSIYRKSHSINKEINDYISIFDLNKIKDKAIKTYSLGERMKAEIVNLFSYKPKLLFLDEPTIGLDLQSQKYVRDMLKKYINENQAHVLLTSHNLKDILELSDEIYLLNDGLLSKTSIMNYNNENLEYLERILC